MQKLSIVALLVAVAWLGVGCLFFIGGDLRLAAVFHIASVCLCGVYFWLGSYENPKR